MKHTFNYHLIGLQKKKKEKEKKAHPIFLIILC